ncbi:PadR family transcriptional regulator [Halostreptopolyspora alba]|uniref:PadR family transcriptional regulator n=1 Tax=Halostreptopolyspora alba TaxID=2487137 RepID=A0A3N0E5E4_9ACTN|nr:PadR family transcriptional regulator [Nocardiopsaceae bacterium YIM 96095]
MRVGVLLLLAEESLNGYEMINEAAERSGGHWRLTSAKVHPMLDQLAEEGLVQLSEESGGGRQRPYELTPAGRALVDSEFAGITPPWVVHAPVGDESEPQQESAQIEIQGPSAQFQEVAAQFTAAANQVAQVGTSEQIERARELVAESKRNLYRILAEDDPAPQSS